MKELSYLNKYFLKYKWYLLGGIFFVMASNTFSVLSPRILGAAIDMVIENVNLNSSFKGFELQTLFEKTMRNNVLVFCGLSIAAAFISGGFTFLMRQTIIVMSRLIEFDLKNEIYQHYQALDTAFYKRNNTGDLMNRITEDVSAVRMYLGPAIMYSINVLFLFSFVIYTMISISPTMTFWVVLPMPILAGSIFFVNGLINEGNTKIQAQLSNLTTHAQEFYSGIRVLKSYVQEKNAISFYEEESENYKQKSLDLARIEAFFFPLMVFLIGLSTILVIFVGGRLVMQGKLTPGNLLEFVIYVNMLTWPVTSVGWVAALIQKASASQKRINNFLKTESEIVNPSEEAFTLNGDIIFNKVNFVYPDTGIKAIEDVSFHIKEGEKWAIIGRTGSGKSTLADLIFRLYDVSEGSIKIDDRDIQKVNLEALRHQIGFVPQDVFLFSDTVADNIRFADSSLSIDSVKQAAKDASIHKEIMEFPEQYDTIVGERGVTLSGGQRQRISIARSLVKQPKLIIFDDALSAVDANTEHIILNNLKNALQNKTVLIITHRIFALLEFDKILVLDEGKVAEIGNHNELMKLKGIYYQTYQKQQLEGVEA